MHFKGFRHRLNEQAVGSGIKSQISQEIRKFNNFDRLIEGHVDYKLDDGSVVVISEETQQRINSTFGQHKDVVQYMRESKDNFLSVLNQLEG